MSLHIKRITDITIPELEVYSHLTERQLRHIYEPSEGIFIAESGRVTETAVDAGYEPLSLLMDEKLFYGSRDSFVEKVYRASGEDSFTVYISDFDTLKNLTGFPLTRGVLCVMRRNRLKNIQEICMGEHPVRRIAVLEDVMNPTNVGAIFRSAAALGIDAVLLTPACSDPLYRRSVRVSMGSVLLIPWTYIDTDTDPDMDGHWVDMLKDMGFTTAAMALDDDSISIKDPRLSAAEKLAVILGTEGDGLKESTIKRCDFTCRIPMAHGVDSLNVAAASAVVFWQLCSD